MGKNALKCVLEQIIEIYDVDNQVRKFTYEENYQELFNNIDYDRDSSFMFWDQDEPDFLQVKNYVLL